MIDELLDERLTKVWRRRQTACVVLHAICFVDALSLLLITDGASPEVLAASLLLKVLVGAIPVCSIAAFVVCRCPKCGAVGRNMAYSAHCHGCGVRTPW